MKLALSIFKFFNWIKIKSTHIKSILLNLSLQTEHSHITAPRSRNRTASAALTSLPVTMLPLLNRNPYPDFQGKRFLHDVFLHDVFFPGGHFQPTSDEIHVAAAAAKSLQPFRLCATPQMAAHQAPPSLGFSRQEHWSGLPFPSPMHESESEDT